MVYYFTSDVVSPPFTLFMGAEKYESKVFNVSNTKKISFYFSR